MDATSPNSADDSASGPEAKQLAVVCPPHALVFGATCPALVAWGAAVGFDVVLLGAAADPLAAVRDLCVAEHGRGGMVMDDVMPAMEGWDDWILEPIASGAGTLPNVEPWGGTLRVGLSPGDTTAAFARRFAAALAPLEAMRHAFAAGPARDRWLRGAMPPPMPRFTMTGDGWVRARRIYRWSSQGDSAYAARAILAASGVAGPDQSVLDLIAEGEGRLDVPGDPA